MLNFPCRRGGARDWINLEYEEKKEKGNSQETRGDN